MFVRPHKKAARTYTYRAVFLYGVKRRADARDGGDWLAGACRSGVYCAQYLVLDVLKIL